MSKSIRHLTIAILLLIVSEWLPAQSSAGGSVVRPLFRTDEYNTKLVIVDSMAYRREGRANLSSTKWEGYVLCTTYVEEKNRNPRWRDPADDYAGYRLIQASPNVVIYQYWVMPWRKLFGKRFWLEAIFHVTWIRADATTEDRAQCTDKFRTLPARDFNASDPPPPIASTPVPPSPRFYVYMYVQCIDRQLDNYRSEVPLLGTSPNSCADAQRDAIAQQSAKNVCKENGNYRYPNNEQIGWYFTSSGTCP